MSINRSGCVTMLPAACKVTNVTGQFGLHGVQTTVLQSPLSWSFFMICILLVSMCVLCLTLLYPWLMPHLGLFPVLL